MVTALAVGVGVFSAFTPRVGDTPGPRVFTQADLDRIILGASDAPLDTSYLGPDPVHPLLLPVWYRSDEEQQQFLSLPGYVDGATADFRGGTYLFVSAALLFEDADAAAGALAAYAAEIADGWRLTNPEPVNPGLGDDSLHFSGPAVVQNGEPGFYYFWRIDNLLLEAVGVGNVSGSNLAAMEAATRAMAVEMNSRAGGTVATRAFGADDVSRLVMTPAELLGNVELGEQVDGPTAFMDIYFGYPMPNRTELDAAIASGQIAGSLRHFDMTDASGARVGSTVAGGFTIATAIAAYETNDHASRALAAFMSVFYAHFDEDAVSGLGETYTTFEQEFTAEDRPCAWASQSPTGTCPTTVSVWRADNLLISVHGTGDYRAAVDAVISELRTETDSE